MLSYFCNIGIHCLFVTVLVFAVMYCEINDCLFLHSIEIIVFLILMFGYQYHCVLSSFTADLQCHLQ